MNWFPYITLKIGPQQNNSILGQDFIHFLALKKDIWKYMRKSLLLIYFIRENPQEKALTKKDIDQERNLKMERDEEEK